MNEVDKQQWARFWSRVDVVQRGKCWLWRGRLDDDGYGRFGNKRAPRLAWELWNGSIPDDLTIDHECRVRACVNPGHLRLRTMADNRADIVTLPGGNNHNGLLDRCKRGHPFSSENTKRTPDGRRVCRQCARDRNREYQRLYRQRKRASAKVAA